MRTLKILWDMENCGIPAGVPTIDVSKNVFDYLENNTQIKFCCVGIFAYLDLTKVPKSKASQLITDCWTTDINLICTPGLENEKEAADHAIMLALYQYSEEHPPPSLIMLITGNADFAPILHQLRHRGHEILLATPNRDVPYALRNAANHLFDWRTIATSYVDLGDIRLQLMNIVNNHGGVLALKDVAAEYYKEHKKTLCATDFKEKNLTELAKRIGLVVEGEGGKKVVKL